MSEEAIAVEVPYVDLSVQHNEMLPEIMRSLETVIASGRFILSEKVKEFEQSFARFIGVRYAIGVNSGTDALVLSLRALGIGPGDEVITVPNSYITTASSIIIAGAKPVFVDVSEDFTLDVDQLVAAITPRTKAIIPVHLTGMPCDMAPLLQIAENYGLKVIEDAAQAIGAYVAGKSVGGLGAIGCFSLHPLKTLNACGDGGVICTNDTDIYNEIKILRNNGSVDRNTVKYWSSNSRLDEIQAAILLIKLKYLNEKLSKRREYAQFYTEQLSHVKGIQLPCERVGSTPAYHTFMIRTSHRDQLRSYLLKKGIKTAVHYPVPIHLQPCAEDLHYALGSFPVTELHAKTILSLPIHENLTYEQLSYVTSEIKEFYK